MASAGGSQYFKENLEALQAAFEGFLAVNQGVGDNALSKKDPDVQDLLKGFAYISADMRSRTEFKSGDLYQLYGQHLLGALVWSKPSVLMCSLHFGSGEGGRMPGSPIPFHLEAGTEFQIDEKTSRGDPVRLLLPYTYLYQPLEVENEEDGQQASTPFVSFKINRIARNPYHSDSLRFHLLSVEPKQAYNLYALLLHNVVGIDLVGAEGDTLSLPYYALSAGGLKEDTFALGQPKADITELGVLMEYVLVPNKLLALHLDLSLLEVNERREFFEKNVSFTLHFRLKREKGRPNFSVSAAGLKALKMNAVALVNLFTTSSVPVTLQGGQMEFTVKPAGSFGHVVPQLVERVVGIHNDTQRTFHSFNEWALASDLPALTYATKGFEDADGNGALAVELAYGENEPIHLDERFVCTLLCTHGDAIGKTLLHDKRALYEPQEENLPVMHCRAVGEASAYVPMLQGAELNLAMSYEMAINQFTLTSARELQALLRYVAHLCGARGDRIKALSKQIEEVMVVESNALRGTQVVHGQEVRLYMQIGSTPVAEIAFLGEVFSRLYESFAPMNCFTCLHIYDAQDRRTPLLEYPVWLDSRKLVEGKLI